MHCFWHICKQVAQTLRHSLWSKEQERAGKRGRWRRCVGLQPELGKGLLLPHLPFRYSDPCSHPVGPGTLGNSLNTSCLHVSDSHQVCRTETFLVLWGLLCVSPYTGGGQALFLVLSMPALLSPRFLAQSLEQLYYWLVVWLFGSYLSREDWGLHLFALGMGSKRAYDQPSRRELAAGAPLQSSHTRNYDSAVGKMKNF